MVCQLAEVVDVQRVDLKPFCVEVEMKDKKLLYFAFRSDEEVYGWMDDINSRSPLMGVSQPINFVHQVHVGFDPVSGGFIVSIEHSPRLTIAGSPTAVDEAAHVFRNYPRGCSSRSRGCLGCSAILHQPAIGAVLATVLWDWPHVPTGLFCWQGPIQRTGSRRPGTS